MAIRPPGSYVTKKKGSKKGKSRQKENRFSRKRFFNLTTRTPFPVSIHGQTCQTRMRTRQDLRPALIGRTFNVNQGDLSGDNRETHRSFCFKVGDVRGNDCLSFFNGMYTAQDKVSSMVRKWHTLVEANLDVTTKDGSAWRFFVMGVTKRHFETTGRTSYLKASEAKEVRRIMVDVMREEVQGVDTDKLMNKLSTETIGRAIEARCAEIYPMNVIVRRVKAIKNVNIVDLSTLAPQAVGGMDASMMEVVAEE